MTDNFPDVYDELEILEKLINENLTAYSLKVVLERDSYDTLKKNIIRESERIKRAFVKRAFSWKKEKQVEFYIQYHQESIVQLVDDILECIGQSNFDSITDISQERTRLNLCKIAAQSLEQVLFYIERHFSKYFNQDAKSPEIYRYVVHRDLKTRMPYIRHELDKKQISKRLLSIAFYPLEEFVEGIQKKEVSYRKLIYLKELLNELTELSKTNFSERKLDLQLCTTLCYLNYNSNTFYKYCVQEIDHYIKGLDSLPEKIEQLAYLLKLNNQIQVKPGFAFNVNAQPFQYQLSEWISEELFYLEKRQNLKAAGTEQDEQLKTFKLRTNLSVPQIAYLTRVLVDTGVITNKNTLEIIRFVSGIFQTGRTENISWGSLRAKFYQPERHAVESIKDLMINCFNHIRKNN